MKKINEFLYVRCFVLFSLISIILISSCNDNEDLLVSAPKTQKNMKSTRLAGVSASLDRVSVANGNFVKNISNWNPASINYTQTKTITWSNYTTAGVYVSGSTSESHSSLLIPSFNINSINTAFASIKSDGYNFVRIMINHEGAGIASGTTYYGVGGDYLVGSSHKDGLWIAYMDNFIELLKIANTYGLYVIPCLNYLPSNSYYQNSLIKPSDGQGGYYVDDINLFYMFATLINAKVSYIKNFIQYIKDKDPNLLSTVLSYDFHNEINIATNAAPFSRTDLEPTADGVTYNMSNNISRQQCVDANSVSWVNQCLSAMRLKDPSVLAAGSLFTFDAVGKLGPNGVSSNGGDNRYLLRPASLSTYSNLNFIDMHLYPSGCGYTVDHDLNSSEYSCINKTRTPLILGEFGAIKTVYPSITNAAIAMKDLKNYCKNNKGFKGWAFWT